MWQRGAATVLAAVIPALGAIAIAEAAPPQAAPPTFLADSEEAAGSGTASLERMGAWLRDGGRFLASSRPGNPYREEAYRRVVQLLAWQERFSADMDRYVDEYLDEFPDGAYRDELAWTQLFWATNHYEYPDDEAWRPLEVAAAYQRFLRLHPESQVRDRIALEIARGWYSAVVMIVDHPDVNEAYEVRDVARLKARAVRLLEPIVERRTEGATSKMERTIWEAESILEFLTTHKGMSRSGYERLDVEEAEPARSVTVTFYEPVDGVWQHVFSRSKRRADGPAGRRQTRMPRRVDHPEDGTHWRSARGGHAIARADRDLAQMYRRYLDDEAHSTRAAGGQPSCFHATYPLYDPMPGVESTVSLDDWVDNAFAIFTGEVTGTEGGFFGDAPAILIQLRIDNVLRSDRKMYPVRRGDHLYLVYPSGRFDYNGGSICVDNSDSWPARPQVGTQVLVGPQTFGRGPEGNIVVLQAGGVELAFQDESSLGLAEGWTDVPGIAGITVLTSLLAEVRTRLRRRGR